MHDGRATVASFVTSEPQLVVPIAAFSLRARFAASSTLPFGVPQLLGTSISRAPEALPWPVFDCP